MFYWCIKFSTWLLSLIVSNWFLHECECGASPFQRVCDGSGTGVLCVCCVHPPPFVWWGCIHFIEDKFSLFYNTKAIKWNENVTWYITLICFMDNFLTLKTRLFKYKAFSNSNTKTVQSSFLFSFLCSWFCCWRHHCCRLTYRLLCIMCVCVWNVL